MHKVDLILMAPLSPPKGGIATWTEAVLGEVESSTINVYHINTSNRSIEPSEKGKFIRRLKYSTGHVVSLLKELSRVKGSANKKHTLVHICTSGKLGFAKVLLFQITCKIFKVRNIIHLHYGTLERDTHEKAAFSLLSRLCIRMSTGVISIDSGTTEYLRTRGVGNVFYIPNGVSDIRDMKGKASHRISGPLEILFVGRVERAKGVFELLEAVEMLLHEKEMGYKLRMIGKVSDTRIESLIMKNELLRNSVSLEGELDRVDIMTALNECDVFALASHYEGMPYSLIEAMMAGKPVVATKVGGIPEMLGAEYPYYVEKKNSTSIANAIRDIELDIIKRARISRYVRVKYTEEYTSSVMFSRLASTWASALDLI